MFRSVKVRLTFFYIINVFIILSIFGSMLFFVYAERIKYQYISKIDLNLYRLYENIEEALLDNRQEKWDFILDEVTDEIFFDHSLYLQIIHYTKDPPGISVHTAVSKTLSNNIIPFSSHEYREILSKGFSFYTDSIGRDSPFPARIFSSPFKERKTSYYILQIASDLRGMEAEISKTRALIISLLGLCLVILFVTVFIFVRRIFSPVKNIVKRVQMITEKDLSVRIAQFSSNDEIGELVNTFNTMLDRLEDSFSRLRAFSGEISHELKTPLTIIRGEIETILKKERTSEEYQRVLRSILEEESRLTVLIQNLLVLSRIESGQPLRTQPVSLDVTVLEAYEEVLSLAKAKEINIDIGNFEEMYIEGIQGLVKSAVHNILENAIKFSEKNTKIKISLERKGIYACFSSEDQGCGIPQDLIGRICERFYRVDKQSAKGFGLGLAIVRKIMDIHKGKMDIQSSVGSGSVFSLNFLLVKRVPFSG